MMNKVLPQGEQYRDVAETLFRFQSEFGDNISPNCYPQLVPMTKKNCFFQNTPSEVLTVWKTWDAAKKTRFSHRYGNIGELMGKSVDESFLNAIVKFWDPSFHCFTFGQKDICPTLEEISRILGIKLDLPCYSYIDDISESLQGITGIQWNKLKKFVSRHGIDTPFLVRLLQQQRNEEYEFGVMALIIYGTLIFPDITNYVRKRVVPFVRALQRARNPINPLMAVLAEILRSLDHCRKTGGGVFSASVHILYIWARSHFPGKITSLCTPFQPDVIHRFYASYWGEPLSEEKWVKYFLLFGEQDLQFMAPWMSSVERFLYRYGEYPWVPLLGVYGGTGYAPWSFRQQVGGLHCIPATNGLSEANFDYDDIQKSKVKSSSMKLAWENTRWVGRDSIGASLYGLNKYQAWRDKRAKGFIPPLLPFDELWPCEEKEELPVSMERKNATEIKKLKEKIKQLEEHNDSINMERAQLNDEKNQLRQTLEAAQSEIEELKEENRENRKRKYEENDQVHSLKLDLSKMEVKQYKMHEEIRRLEEFRSQCLIYERFEMGCEKMMEALKRDMREKARSIREVRKNGLSSLYGRLEADELLRQLDTWLDDLDCIPIPNSDNVEMD